MQKAIFYSLKGHLLQAKRRPLGNNLTANALREAQDKSVTADLQSAGSRLRGFAILHKLILITNTLKNNKHIIGIQTKIPIFALAYKNIHNMPTANMVMDEIYFVTTTVVDWIDLFTRPKYKHMILESLSYCQTNKGLKIYGWVLMSNHLHMLASVDGKQSIAEIIRDFKKFTSKQILAELENDTGESRREWMLDCFRRAGMYDKKIKRYRLWQEGYHPLLIKSHEFYMQKLNYIHANPVRQETVSYAEDYKYSSAVDYSGGKDLLDVILI